MGHIPRARASHHMATRFAPEELAARPSIVTDFTTFAEFYWSMCLCAVRLVNRMQFHMCYVIHCLLRVR